jgi:tetratricopeptide (TPR) repeat protein
MGSSSAPMPEIRGRRRAGGADSVGGFEKSMVKEPYQSLVAIDRGAREALSPEELQKLGRPLLADFTGRSDEELVAGLAELGVTVDRASFRRDASSHPSAEELADAYVKRRRLRTKGWGFERTWIALTLLWERWLPERPSLESLDERMMTGYARLEEDDVTGAVESWLEAWPVFLRIFDETRTRSLLEFDHVFGLSELVQNWVGDVEMHLWNAGLQHERFFRSGIELVNEYLARFEAEDELTTENMRRALASFHVELGDLAKADALFEQWLTRDPKWGWGWIGWSDDYRFYAQVKDIERAESLLLRGLAVPEVRDEIDLLERLETLYEDEGRDDDARAMRARMEALPPERARRWSEPAIAAPAPVATVRKPPKVGRNEPCPCGSGKKYKKCCGR